MLKKRHLPVFPLSFIALCIATALLGCGQIEELEQIKDTKATTGPTLFVDGDYTGEASNGTQEFPYKTIQAAINAAKTGQMVFVKSFNDPEKGYKETLYINKNITIQGDGSTKIDADLSPTDNYITKAMIIFDGPNASGIFSGFEVSHSTLNVGAGILCINQARPLIISNIFLSHLHAIYAYSNGQPIIQNNTFRANGYAIYLSGSMSAPAIIRNNFIIDSQDPYPGDWAGIFVYYGAKAEIYNNIIAENYVGIWLRGGVGSSATIANNLFVNNNIDPSNSKGCYIESKSTANVFNNIFDSNLRAISIGTYSSVKMYYNSFSNNDIYNYGGGDIIVTYNITPAYADTIKYEISNKNDFRDLGVPDTNFNDADRSRNDIGIYGGPYAM